MTREFKVFYTGDYLDEAGELTVPYLGVDLFADTPSISYDFLRDQAPRRGEKGYWDRLYSLEIEPHHVEAANAIVIFRPWVKASAFDRGADNLVVIARAGAGYDKIDLQACTANGVAVFNAPDSLTHSTASSAMLFILALAKRMSEQMALVHRGRWDLQPEVAGDDLPEKTLGIVGFGATGQELARLLEPFGMRIVAYSPRALPEKAAALGVTLVESLDELLEQSDFVSLHCRLEPHTRGMIGEHELRRMKPTAYFVNVARGELVDQAMLARALRERWIAGAALDVFEHEPLPVEDPLTAIEHVLLTPHWLPATAYAGRRTMKTMSRGLLAAARGEVPENVLNPEVLSQPSFRRKLSRYA